MSYTVKKLATLSGVSVRTLRFYDEIGLLKPAFYGENQYRYYEEEQLLMLQQILFFREMGVPLADIGAIIHSHEFDKINTLISHKSTLQSNLLKTDRLMKTIDKTISHLRGNVIMRDIEMYEGFDLNKQQEHEKYMLDSGILTQQEINDSWEKVRHWKKSHWENFKEEGEQLNLDLAKALNEGFLVDSPHVQKLIDRHYAWVKNFWTPTYDTYLGLAKMYLEHPDFRLFYNRYAPNLVEFVAQAMGIYADRNLNET